MRQALSHIGSGNNCYVFSGKETGKMYLKTLQRFMIFDTLFPSHPREMIKDSGKDSIRMFNSNIINGAKSGIINRRRGLHKQGYIYKTEYYTDILTL